MDRKPVPGFPGYYASRDGRIWSSQYPGPKPPAEIASKRPLRELKPHRTCQGYRFCCLTVGDKQISIMAHRLVLLAFVGPPMPDKPYAIHYNDIPDDNRLENLRWGSGGDNMRDAYRNGGMNQNGERNHRAKLTEDKVRNIRHALAAGVSGSHLAQQHSVCQATISLIKSRQRWPHVL